MPARTPTVLERDLAGEPRSRPRSTPRDALALARRAFEAGDRLDMQALADELAVSRTTLYRWVGSRELLLGEVLWDRTARTFERVLARVDEESATGAERIAATLERCTRRIARDPALGRFLERDPEFALRVLTTNESRVQRRTIATIVDLLAAEAGAGRLDPPLDVETLAYVLVRIGESFLYSDVITGEPVDVGKAGAAFRAVLRA